MANGVGGRREGAGRPPGSAWRPVVRALRVETVQQMQRVVEADRNPLTVLVDWVLDEGMDIQARLSAASIVMPYLFPRFRRRPSIPGTPSSRSTQPRCLTG